MTQYEVSTENLGIENSTIKKTKNLKSAYGAESVTLQRKRWVISSLIDEYIIANYQVTNQPTYLPTYLPTYTYVLQWRREDELYKFV